MTTRILAALIVGGFAIFLLAFLLGVIQASRFARRERIARRVSGS